MIGRIATAVAAALVAVPYVARAQQQPQHQEAPPVNLYNPDENVGSHTNRAARGSPADRRGSLQGERARSAELEANVAAVTRAAEINQTLIALGKLARDKSHGPGVRQLGAVVQNDAEEANEALGHVATEMQLTLPKEMAHVESARVTALSKRAPDESFDRELMQMMLEQQRLELQTLVGLQMRMEDRDAKGHIARAARSMREGIRATGIELKPLQVQ